MLNQSFSILEKTTTKYSQVIRWHGFEESVLLSFILLLLCAYEVQVHLKLSWTYDACNIQFCHGITLQV